jgi:hypothetical protein
MAEAARSRSLTSVVRIHLTESFSADVATMNVLLGVSAEDINLSIIRALRKLHGYSWDETLPIRRTGIYGDSYLFEFCDDYSLTFRIFTDRDEHKKPIVDHYYLKNLLRRR